MSKNIKIAQKGVDQTFDDVDKVQANKIGGGSQNWIPIDEAWKYADIDNITITENGTYKAGEERCDGFGEVEVDLQFDELSITENGSYSAKDHGCAGFSQVTVDTSDMLGEDEFTENGTYVASSEDLEGFSKVTVDVEEEVTGQINISENGVYIAEDDDVVGYDTVNVNVPGGNPAGYPRGREAKGTATTSLQKFDSVKISMHNEVATFVRNAVSSEKTLWLTYDNILIRSGDPYNGYDVLTDEKVYPNISEDGTFMGNYIKGGEGLLVFRLSETKVSENVYTGEFKFVHMDGTSSKVTFSYKSIYSFCYNYMNGLTAVIYRPVGSTGRVFAVDIYNKDGSIATKELCRLNTDDTDFSSWRMCIPVSKTAVAMVVHDDTSAWNCIISVGGISQNSHKLQETAVYAIETYFYNNAFYINHSTGLKKINVKNISSDYDSITTEQLDLRGRISNYGHICCYIALPGSMEGKRFRVIDIDTGNIVYQNIVNRSTAFYVLENDNYICLGYGIGALSAPLYSKTENNNTQISKTSMYPRTDNEELIGIMKDDCAAGEEGTVLVLFD